MVSCEYCSEGIDALAYECNYCSQSFCRSHRLPEVHDCPRISHARPPSSTPGEADAMIDQSRGAERNKGENIRGADIDLQELRRRAEAEAEGQPYSVAEIQHTVGTTPDSNFDSSPDVAVDGSIKQSGSEQEDTTDSPANTSDISRQRVAFILLSLTAVVILYIVFVT